MSQNRFKKSNFIWAVLLILSVAAAFFLLGQDARAFGSWWLAGVYFSVAFYPLGAVLFAQAEDKGWLFSKALGIGAGGYLTWFLVRIGAVKFTTTACIALTALPALVIWLLFLRFGTREQKRLPDSETILKGELIFLLFFLFWTWCSGFAPDAFGTEKPMDYGFMAAMMRSDTLSARDLWYSEGVINYYYGGQYYAVYLTKLTLARVNETYHLMMALVAAFAFALPWSIVRGALKDNSISDYLSEVGGLFAGACVSLAGNVHYLLYGLFGSLFQLSGYEDYWFPSSTRYIGHNPVTEDQCIHEFPSYSFVLGDLHAHVINLFLVLAFLGIMYAWYRTCCLKDTPAPETEDVRGEEKVRPSDILKFCLQPHVLAAGFLIGIYQWTNYWDFIIYYTVFLFTVSCISYRNRERGRKIWLIRIAASMITVYVLQKLIALPFTLEFITMFKGVGISIYHTVPYQLLVLWGLPILLSLLLAGWVVRKNISAVDVFWVMLAICGLGLIFIPELVYVKDIYEDGYARSNTMFKLTYQAYVMLGLMMPYASFRILFGKKDGLKGIAGMAYKAVTGFCTCILFLTIGYSGYAITCWFGNILDPAGYEGLDSIAFLEEKYPEDVGAIRYLEENVSGQPVVLEAPGDSYSDHCRVSAFTGLPTIEGWYVHEWLWRDDPEDLNRKLTDIEQIYTNPDSNYVELLLSEYDVSYIFIGSCEYEEYGEYLNKDLLCSLGTVVYDGGTEGNPDGALVIRIK